MLSDSCSEFLTTFGEAARKLATETHWYADPDSPFRYGQEIDALRRACVDVADDPQNVEAGASLLRLALLVMRFHDTPLGRPKLTGKSRRWHSRDCFRRNSRQIRRRISLPS